MATYKNRQCYFCENNIAYVDYKNTHLLRKFLTQYLKIVPRYYSGSCLKHQKKVMSAVKNARGMALMPFTR